MLLGNGSLVPVVIHAAGARIPVLVATSTAATATATAWRSFTIVSTSAPTIIECATLRRRRSGSAATIAAATAATGEAAATATTGEAAATAIAAATTAFFTRRSLAFGMRKIYDETTTTNVDAAKTFDRTFGCFCACHRDKPEAALATIGVHGQVHAHDGASASRSDHCFDLFDARVVRQVAYVERAVRCASGTARAAAEAAATAAHSAAATTRTSASTRTTKAGTRSAFTTGRLSLERSNRD